MKQYIDIDSNDLERLQAEGARVVDIRMAHEWKQSGVIPDSELISFDCEDKHGVVSFLEELRKRGIGPDRPIALVCRRGNRTLIVARFLVSQGFERVYNLKNGIHEWISLNKPVAKV